MPFLNLGIVAHVDAGKTSLTERLLFDAGVIERLGSVDAGSTATDTLELERRRGITIRTAVARFPLGPLTVNLIDTPGHPDFIAEVERALRVLDGAVLVVSAVEGVQAQTRILLRTLRRLRIPTLVFVNKTDRTGADADRVLRDIPDAVPMWTDHTEALADRDEQALASFVAGRPTPRGTLERLTAAAAVLPAFRGSAITGEGIPALAHALATLLPAASGDPGGPLEATVFKIEADGSALVRVHTGTIRVRDRVGDDRVTSIDGGARDAVPAGDIGRVRGLRSVRVGDQLGGARAVAIFPPPTHESTIRPVDPQRRGELHRALTELAGQDPLIGLRLDRDTGELTVTLYGEVQKEVIRDTLAGDFGIDVCFGQTITLMREKPAGSGRAGVEIGQPGNPHLAGLHLLVEPGSGIEVHLEAPAEHVPQYVYHSLAAFREAVEGYVRESLARGKVRQWDVDDIRITITDCAYAAPESTAGDFRRVVPGLLGRALAEAGTLLCEPVQQVEITCPADTLSAVLGVAARHNLTPGDISVQDRSAVVGGVIPVERLGELEAALPGLTRGEASVETAAVSWRPVSSFASGGSGSSPIRGSTSS